MRGLRLHLVLVVALSLVCVASVARAQTGGMAAPGLRETVLDNGLRLVVLPDGRAPIVTHMVWYQAGSADDPVGKSGLAHFLEHLMFTGTAERPKGDFVRAVNRVGGLQNAFTSFDYSVYFQQIPADALPDMMRFEADRMVHLDLTEEAVAIEHAVIKEERRVRIDNDPASRMVEEMDAALFLRHPYRNPVIGWMHEIEGLTRADAAGFYRRFYRPDNAVVIVVGDVRFDDVLAMARATYGRVPRGAQPVLRHRLREPVVDTRRTVSLSDARIRAETFRKSWVVPSVATASSGDAEALSLLAELLGGGPHGRLYQSEVLGTGRAKSVSARYDGHGLDYGYFSLYGTPLAAEDLLTLEAAFDAAIAQIAAVGVPADALAAARRRVLRAEFFANDDPMMMARQIGMVLSTGSDLDWFGTEADRLAAVTPEDIRRVAKMWLRADRAVSGYLRSAEEVGQ
ncbi:M16 family metallopeptidase [Primorskyibacter sp. 2E107]|uniref:M16 family metallopeptidase n=1 Tax=Primorskyibacter sp. 2E107 TaxID=3403458 RepID=UPI003AF915FC